jgi:hypothetical protein
MAATSGLRRKEKPFPRRGSEVGESAWMVFMFESPVGKKRVKNFEKTL